MDPDPALDPHEAAGAVDVEDLAHALEHEQQTIAAGDVAEGVARSRDVHAQPAPIGIADRAGELG